MKFLIDENLPVDLAAWLREAGVEARHVRDVGLAQTPDDHIVERARREREIIVTQDRGLAAVAGGEPAFWLQVVWVRLGNASIEQLLAAWASQWDGMREALARGEERVEIGNDHAP